ncbi:hypothetical protein [Sphingomonas sp. BK481]|uniref:hypothetical protein n=1 Tax=Sphingomonas sp. BK481 TaxID=2586981 RepID=UPI001621CA71|nr:hypothetical protein [Sphingomonas sp. BK481]MBB3588781.1 hypothetical protein [Sphingomonas sp. BK481]
MLKLPYIGPMMLTLGRSPGLRVRRAAGQQREQPGFDTGGKDLRIGEPCDQIEQRARPATRDRPAERKALRRMLDARIGEQAVATVQPPLPHPGEKMMIRFHVSIFVDRC